MALNFANNNSLSAITSLPASISGGGMTLIQEQTASSSATISFTSGIDSTYDSYVFKFYNIHPSGINRFQFNGSIDAGSNYNVVKTTSVFIAGMREDGADNNFIYQGGDDHAQGTGFQDLMAFGNQDADNDHSLNGTLQLFNPSSTTFVKNFIAITQGNIDTNYSVQTFVAGYFNNTNNLDAIRFQMTSGTFDGVIKLYGIS